MFGCLGITGGFLLSYGVRTVGAAAMSEVVIALGG